MIKYIPWVYVDVITGSYPILYVHIPHSCQWSGMGMALQWRHNEGDGVSNHRRLDCLHNRLLSIKVPPVDSPHKGPVTQKMFPFADVIMGEYDELQASSRKLVAFHVH